MSILYSQQMLLCSVCIFVTTLASLELSFLGVFVYLIGVVAQKCLFGKTQCFKHGIWVKSMRFMQAKQPTMQKSTLQLLITHTYTHTALVNLHLFLIVCYIQLLFQPTETSKAMQQRVIYIIFNQYQKKITIVENDANSAE